MLVLQQTCFVLQILCLKENLKIMHVLIIPYLFDFWYFSGDASGSTPSATTSGMSTTDPPSAVPPIIGNGGGGGENMAESNTRYGH